MRIGALALAILAGLAVGGCGTNIDRRERAQAISHQRQPLVEWVQVKPEHLAEVAPARLQAEGVALVIARTVRETPAGERLGISDFVMLRNVSTSTHRPGLVQKAGDDSQVGWAVLFVPPGQYALNRSGTRQRIGYGMAGVRNEVSDINGHPYVPLSATIPIAAGDVVYVGTVVWEAKDASDRKPRVKIRDERAAAARWTAENLPAFSKAMTTRLLPPPVDLIN